MRILCTRCSTRRRDHLQSVLARRACGHVAPYSGFGRAHDALPMKELESQFCGFCRQCDLRETQDSQSEIRRFSPLASSASNARLMLGLVEAAPFERPVEATRNLGPRIVIGVAYDLQRRRGMERNLRGHYEL